MPWLSPLAWASSLARTQSDQAPPGHVTSTDVHAEAAALLSFGVISTWVGEAHETKVALRILHGGCIAMAVTFGKGKLFGQSPK